MVRHAPDISVTLTPIPALCMESPGEEAIPRAPEPRGAVLLLFKNFVEKRPRTPYPVIVRDWKRGRVGLYSPKNEALRQAFNQVRKKSRKR